MTFVNFYYNLCSYIAINCSYIAMNNLFDTINSWSERLTIRVLRMLGYSEVSINKVNEAFINRNNVVSEADKSRNNIGKYIKYFIIITLIGGILYIALKFKQLITKN